MTNINELIKQLQERAIQAEWSGFLKGSKRNLAAEAAAALETLRAELEEARKDAAETYLQGYGDALAHVAMYVDSHCVDGEDHSEIILSLPKPKVTAREQQG